MQALCRGARQLQVGISTFVRDSGVENSKPSRPVEDPSLDMNIWVDTAEKELIERAARLAHVPASTFLRDASISRVACIVQGLVPRNGGPGGYQHEARPPGTTTPRNDRGIGFVR